MRKTLFLIVALLLLAQCRQDEIVATNECDMSGIDLGESHPKALAFQSLIDEYVTKGLPGIDLLIRDENGRWVGTSGKADIAQNIDLLPCHISKVASITKIFIGTLVMKLVEEDQLDLDASITKWLPSKYTSKVNNAGLVTLRQLLNHTTGIYDIIDDDGFYLAILNDPAKFWKPDELLKYVYNKPAVFAPGERVEYSNTNLLLTAMIIEAATGRSHAVLLREKILNPLGLENTFYHWHEQLPDFVAQGYFDLYNNGTILNMSNFNTGSGNGYGGLYSTVFDMQVFIESLLRDKTLLSEAGLEEMIRITSEDISRNIAFGVSIRKDFLDRPPNEYGLGHRGRDLAYSADLYYFPNQDLTMSLIVNYGTDAKSELQQVFFDLREEMVDLLMAQ